MRVKILKYGHVGVLLSFACFFIASCKKNNAGLNSKNQSSSPACVLPACAETLNSFKSSSQNEFNNQELPTKIRTLAEFDKYAEESFHFENRWYNFHVSKAQIWP